LHYVYNIELDFRRHFDILSIDYKLLRVCYHYDYLEHIVFETYFLYFGSFGIVFFFLFYVGLFLFGRVFFSVICDNHQLDRNSSYYHNFHNERLLFDAGDLQFERI
jgi:hypothetical protein